MLDDGNHTWKVPAFSIQERSGRLDVVVHAESVLIPSRYVLESSVESGSIQTGFLPESPDSINTVIRHIYLGYGYERPVQDMLARIRPAGIEVHYVEVA